MKNESKRRFLCFLNINFIDGICPISVRERKISLKYATQKPIIVSFVLFNLIYTANECKSSDFCSFYFEWKRKRLIPITRLKRWHVGMEKTKHIEPPSFDFRILCSGHVVMSAPGARPFLNHNALAFMINNRLTGRR